MKRWRRLLVPLGVLTALASYWCFDQLQAAGGNQHVFDLQREVIWYLICAGIIIAEFFWHEARNRKKQ